MPAIVLTYAELAVRLGRSEAGAKSLAKRKRWKRSVGNDGLTRITLDEPELAELANPDRRGVGRPPANAAWAKGADKGGEPRSNPIHALQAKLAVAEVLAAERGQELAELRERVSDRDALASQIEALRSVLAEVRQDRDRWHQAATTPWWRRLWA